MNKKIIIAGGGTGGHIFPALSIAQALKQMAPGTEILFVGAKGKMEMEKIPQAGFPVVGLDIAGWNRSSLIKNIKLPFKLMKSFWQVRQIFKTFRPDAVIGVGGYSSFPVLRYAQAKGIKTFIHESNSFAGKSNIWLGKKATRIFTGTEGMEKFFPKEKICVSGNPVRKNICRITITKEEALRQFGLALGKKTFLVVGGSQGARSINEAIDKGLEKLLNAGLQVIWQTGIPYADKAKTRSDGKEGVWTGAFIQHMEVAYAAADLVVSRAGAITVAELCVVKKPVIFVPYPHAAEDHQTKNAERLVRKNAAWMVKDNEAEEKLVPAIIELSGNEEKMSELIQNIGKLAVTDADEKIAMEILKWIEK
ncbi:MAG: undecaprenyldiphospho-muramoylpentapeptide beta-N-acetylglucosaminyltransferase [Chitinophagaceae bacterium]|nr:undecaprenyldiphospho-muramoylpentapeptide beta-N-acetylglucosaminyltransferase [Chitinophagaceae bacterium]